MASLSDLQNRLRHYGQEHLLQFQHELNPLQHEELATEIEGIDFDLIARLYRDLVQNFSSLKTSEVLAPLQGQAWKSFSPAKQVSLTDMGMQALREGKAAAFLVAGGQGTRLGHLGPKGTFDIGLPSGKSLFQLQAERLLKLSRDCGHPIPWYIMTSRENHEATVAFFQANDFFQLDQSSISFFQQAELPVVDAEGKILLAGKGRISLGPNGNGGCFPALKSSGALEDMRHRGVEWIFTYSVDNALVRICDPNFLGFAIASHLPAASKAVAKAGPEERVGVFCLRDERPSVLEYSEMTPEMCVAQDDKGNLLYGSANVAMHLFRRDFLETHADASLPYHVAHKKIPHVSREGELLSPSLPNAYKFELFMFDLFPKAPGMSVLDVHREEEFAPVKNPDASGTDSPATARHLIMNLHRHWAQLAGLSPKELNGLEVEISPLTSYAGEGLSPSAFRRDSTNPYFGPKVLRILAGYLAVAALKLLGHLPPRLIILLGTPWIPFYAWARRDIRHRLRDLKSGVPFPVPSALAYYQMRLRLAALSLRHLTGHYQDYVIRVEGEEHYQAACISGKPVAILGWHQGPVELLHRIPSTPKDGRPFYIATIGGFTEALSRLLKRGRQQDGKEVSNSKSFPAALRSWERRRGAVAVMMDQVPGHSKDWLPLWNGAVEIPFPENLWDWMKCRDALFIVVASRLASDDVIVFQYEAIRPDIEDLKSLMERKISAGADQYNWSYPKIRINTPEGQNTKTTH